MTPIQKKICLGASVTFFVAMFVVFAALIPGYLHYQEQYQLFLFTSEYFRSVALVPGGLATWISRFFTQFYISGISGALVCALFLSGTQVLAWKASGRVSFASYAFSFIPAAVLAVSMFREYSLLVPAVAMVLCLAAAVLTGLVGNVCVRRTVAVAAAPVLYFICGPAAIVYAAFVFAREKWWTALAAAALVAVCPFIMRPYFSYDLYHLFTGAFYYKDPEIFPTAVWVSFGVFALYGLVSVLEIRSSVPALIALAVVLVGLPVASCLTIDLRYEDELEYSNLVRLQKWDEIISKADRNKPLDRMSISCVNLALACKGTLGDRMFSYYQCDTDALIPPYEKVHTDNVFASDIYYHMGMVNAAQSHIFEAKEAIPSLEKSSRAYQRLAQTKSINRKYAASQKYLDALSHTLFYRGWALSFDHDSDEMKRMRSWRYHSDDFIFDYNNMYSQLGILYEDNRDNYIAYQYAVAWSLLKKELNWFMKFFRMRDFEKVPVHYQEAFLLVWADKFNGPDGLSLEGLPGWISTRIKNRFVKFVNDSHSISDTKYLYKKYGDTYWFYYFYDYAG